MRNFDCSAARALLTTVAMGAFFFFGNNLLAQRSRANSQQIDPIRVGDAVEVSKFRKWCPGTVLSFEDGVAEVEYSYSTSVRTSKFPLNEIRFPNGEGGWRVWKAAKLEINVEARYITRDEDNVMIRDADGKEYEIPIKELSLQLKQVMKKVPLPGDENRIDGVEPFRAGDDVEVQKSSRWYDGVVKQMIDGKIEVEFESSGSTQIEQFAFEDVKFPRGEGYWQSWKDESGKFEVLARYASRTKTHVTLITAAGKKIEVPIDKLSFKLKKRLSKTPVTGSENLVKGVSPLRTGDLVEFKDGSYWQSGTVTDLIKGKAMIAYTSEEKDYSKAVDLDEITFANGQGPWMKWQDESKEFNVIARYLDRTDTQVKVLTEAGKEVSFDIERLTPKLQLKVKQSVSWTPLPEAVSFARSPKRIAFMSSAPEFSKLAIDSSKIQPSAAAPVLADGGFGFPMSNGNQISLAKPTSVDGWIAVGTYSDGKNSSYPITQLYWVNPATAKLENGPGFPGFQRIVDHSSTQKRLLTSLMSTGSSPQAIGFCTYRASPGSVVAEPEYRLDLPESTSRYGRSTSYQASLLNEHHLLLARDSKLTLYDFKSATTVFELTGLTSNQFQLHPSGDFVLVRQNNGLSLYETATGSQVAFDGSAPFEYSGFSQDGRRIVGIGPKFVYIWDMTGSDAAKKLPANNLRSGSEFGHNFGTRSGGFAAELIGDEWIWRDGLLYNTAKQMLVWSYRSTNTSYSRERLAVKKKNLIGEKVLVTATLSDRSSATLALIGIAKVPHKKAIETMNQVDVEEMVMLKPGVGVRIEAEGDPRVRKAIQQAIAANEWPEDPDSKIIISAYAKIGEAITENYEKRTVRTRSGGSLYNPFRRPDPNNVFSRTVRPWTQSIRISYGDGTAWSRRESSYAPGSASSVTELDQKIRDASSPKFSLFEDLEFPKTLVYPSFKDGLGNSRVTLKGFADHVNEVPKEDEDKADEKP